MDIGTLVGLIIAWVLVFAAIVMGGSPIVYINIPSLLITVGGAIAAAMIHYPLPTVLAIGKFMGKALKASDVDFLALFSKMSDMAARARRDGLLALEDDIEKMTDLFMKKGFQMAVDGNATEIIRAVMDEDIGSMMQRHINGAGIFKALGTYAPAFGMIGTLIGLVAMLQNMSDPSQLGAGMAVALLTTLYGAMVANMIALPIAGKLEQKSAEEVSLKNMVIVGVIAIQEGNSPRIVEEKLRSYLPPNLKSQTEGK